MNHSEIRAAFWRYVERQTLERGQPPLSPFSQTTAESILVGGLAALEDRLAGTARYQVVSAPTGSGKSSYAWALIGAVIEAVPGSSAVFLCDTIVQCEDTYRELAKVVPRETLAIWTSSHDAARPAEGVSDAPLIFKRDLPSFPVIVVTHKLYKGPNGHLAQEHSGGPRTLTVVDERPEEVSIYDIDQGDAGKARDWALQEFGDGSPALEAFKALEDYLGHLWELERAEGKTANFRALERSDLTWFSSEEATAVLDKAPSSVGAQVVGFAQALATGYAFFARYSERSRGGRFVGYRMTLPIRPGTVLLDATSDIDGVSRLVRWREPVPCPSLSYENLTVTLLAPPEKVWDARERISRIVTTRERASPYAEWVKATIVAKTAPGEKVLAVVHKGFLDHEYLPASAESLDADAYDLEGRKVAFINWGHGIGPNRWKEATSVFLFGEFHIPTRATVATALGLLDQPAGTPRLDKMQSPNSQDEVLSLLRQGHLFRWEKQLAMRGNARNITHDGVCGHQRLFVTSEFGRFMEYREALFPGATFVLDQSAQTRIKTARGAHALAVVLMSSDALELTTRALQEACGVDLPKHGARLLAAPVVRAAIKAGGWRYVKGGGRGKPSRFEREAA